MLKQENYQTMLIERRENGVAVVSLNRPEKLNAVNGTSLCNSKRNKATDVAWSIWSRNCCK